MMSCCGSTRAPSRAVRPLTWTRPAEISSSQARRLPKPAAASTFCNRIPCAADSGSVSANRGIVVEDRMVGQVVGDLGQLLEGGEPEAVEEVVGGRVQDR